MNRSDPKVRENDYINALGKWIRTPYSLVFCENSDYDLSRIKGCVTKNIEMIQFYGQDFPRHLGKGFGEMLTIKHAMETSQLIKGCEYVIKVNGRYYISNINKIAQALLRYSDTYVMTDSQKELRWADSYLFAFKPSFVRNYLQYYQRMLNDSDGFYLEHALARATLRAVSDGHRWRPLPVMPVPVGFSGTTGRLRKTSTAKWCILELLHHARNRLNRKRLDSN